jgi:hypothetical protein
LWCGGSIYLEKSILSIEYIHNFSKNTCILEYCERENVYPMYKLDSFSYVLNLLYLLKNSDKYTYVHVYYIYNQSHISHVSYSMTKNFTLKVTILYQFILYYFVYYLRKHFFLLQVEARGLVFFVERDRERDLNTFGIGHNVQLGR